MRKLGTLAIVALLLAAVACAGGAQEQPRLASSAGCAELGDAVRAATPFYEPGYVYAARKIEKRQFLARAIQPKRTMGARLYMHATPGVTEEYLERALTCHAAHGQAVQPNDPVHPADGAVAKIDVTSSGGSLVVAVIGEDHKVGEEIWKRSKAFASPSGAVTVEQVARHGSAGSAL